jgi:ubiquitin-protein ligase
MTGLEGSPFAGGEYVCEITLPPNYPSDPPKIKYITPNGRFTVDFKIELDNVIQPISTSQ